MTSSSKASSRRVDRAGRRPAARPAVDVAAGAARLRQRAAADRHRLRPRAARGAARRADGAVARPAGPRRPRRRRAAGAAGRARTRGLGGADLVPAGGLHAQPAPVPRPRLDRAGAARRPAPGLGGDRRPPGAAGVPRPALGAARPGVRARPPVHEPVLDRRLGAAARRDRRAADGRAPGAGPAGAVRAAHRADLGLAAGRGAGRPTSGAPRPSGWPGTCSRCPPPRRPPRSCASSGSGSGSRAVAGRRGSRPTRSSRGPAG